MTSELYLNKALYALDAGRTADGERLLSEALRASELEGDQYTLGRVLCCLGDLLFQLGRLAEAREILERFLSLPYEDDVLEQERRRANELLAGLTSETDS